MLAQRLAIEGPDGVTVSSTGIRGAVGAPPSLLVKEGMQFGLDLSEHVSNKIELPDIQRADLIISFTREHVREIVLADTSSFEKTYTMREFVRRGAEKGPRYSGEGLPEWLFRMHLGRRHLDLLGDSPVDDTPDPMGGEPEDYRHMLMELAASTKALHELVWPMLPT
jgi:protein-tyrosine-phosphatase